MSSDTYKLNVEPERKSPWPSGVDQRTGLFPIVTVGICPKTHAIDFSINSAANDDLPPLRRQEVVENLEALVRHFKAT